MPANPRNDRIGSQPNLSRHPAVGGRELDAAEVPGGSSRPLGAGWYRSMSCLRCYPSAVGELGWGVVSATLRESFSSLPGLNLADRLAEISIDSPVLGLRPVRA